MMQLLLLLWSDTRHSAVLACRCCGPLWTSMCQSSCRMIFRCFLASSLTCFPVSICRRLTTRCSWTPWQTCASRPTYRTSTSSMRKSFRCMKWWSSDTGKFQPSTVAFSKHLILVYIFLRIFYYFSSLFCNFWHSNQLFKLLSCSTCMPDGILDCQTAQVVPSPEPLLSGSIICYQPKTVLGWSWKGNHGPGNSNSSLLQGLN